MTVFKDMFNLYTVVLCFLGAFIRTETRERTRIEKVSLPGVTGRKENEET